MSARRVRFVVLALLAIGVLTGASSVLSIQRVIAGDAWGWARLGANALVLAAVLLNFLNPEKRRTPHDQS